MERTIDLLQLLTRVYMSLAESKQSKASRSAEAERHLGTEASERDDESHVAT